MSKTNDIALGGNAFPKISGKARDFLKQLGSLKAQNSLPAKLVMEGTVKLHGSHADIVFDLNQTSTGWTFQSRNRICSPTERFWPSIIAKHTDELSILKENILARFQEQNPETQIDRTKPLIVAGEWIGPKVQKGVGVSELSYRFVICTIQINGVWQNDADYAGVEAPAASIYNVLRVPQYQVELDTSDLTMTNPALLDMQNLADEVEADCPFAATFGVFKSRGEGIVWKPGTPEGRADARYWLKTKGPIIGPENRIRTTTMIADTTEKVITSQDLQAIITCWVTDRRLQQAEEFITEMRVDQQKSPKVFRRWIADDILKEEATEIEELKKVFPGIEQMLRQKVGEVAGKAWEERVTPTSASFECYGLGSKQ